MIQPIITLIILVISLHIQMFVMVACRSWHASRCRTHYVLYWSLVCIVLRSHHCWKTKLCEIIREPFFPLKLSPEAFSIVCFSPEAFFLFFSAPISFVLNTQHNTDGYKQQPLSKNHEDIAPRLVLKKQSLWKHNAHRRTTQDVVSTLTKCQSKCVKPTTTHLHTHARS